jgi:ATP-dependent 26S proteasome regulatory subunit
LLFKCNLYRCVMATNRADTLDPALLRPGRLDRKIECPAPDRRQKRLVFQVCTAKMNLSDEVGGCLYKLKSFITHSLETAWFQPLKL